MKEKPWEELPDDGYWRALLGEANPNGAQLTMFEPTPPAASPNGKSGADRSPAGVARSSDLRAGEQRTNSPDGWALAEASYAQGNPLELRVVGYNRGGVLVDLGDVRGFVPASQLVQFPRKVQEEERMLELQRYVGTTLRVQVIEFDRAHNRLILSERVANPPAPRADQVLAAIQPQQTRPGVIRNVADFGAFVDLGGVEGLIHVSELSWQRVNHPRDVLTPGQHVEVFIMDVDREQKRIACSIKRLTPNPWVQAAEKFKPGDVIEGTVTNVVEFGAFVRIADGVEGLIHVSELAEGSFLHPRDVVREGDIIRVCVLSVDPARQRIGLSLRGANGSSGKSRRETNAPRKVRVIRDEPPPPPDPAYWESLAQSGN